MPRMGDVSYARCKDMIEMQKQFFTESMQYYKTTSGFQRSIQTAFDNVLDGLFAATVLGVHETSYQDRIQVQKETMFLAYTLVCMARHEAVRMLMRDKIKVFMAGRDAEGTCDTEYSESESDEMAGEGTRAVSTSGDYSLFFNRKKDGADASNSSDGDNASAFVIQEDIILADAKKGNKNKSLESAAAAPANSSSSSMHTSHATLASKRKAFKQWAEDRIEDMKQTEKEVETQIEMWIVCRTSCLDSTKNCDDVMAMLVAEPVHAQSLYTLCWMLKHIEKMKLGKMAEYHAQLAYGYAGCMSVEDGMSFQSLAEMLEIKSVKSDVPVMIVSTFLSVLVSMVTYEMRNMKTHPSSAMVKSKKTNVSPAIDGGYSLSEDGHVVISPEKMTTDKIASLLGHSINSNSVTSKLNIRNPYVQSTSPMDSPFFSNDIKYGVTPQKERTARVIKKSTSSDRLNSQIEEPKHVQVTPLSIDKKRLNPTRLVRNESFDDMNLDGKLSRLFQKGK